MGVQLLRSYHDFALNPKSPRSSSTKCEKAVGNAIPVNTYCRHNAEQSESPHERVSLSL
jgi:hypothetical protein